MTYSMDEIVQNFNALKARADALEQRVAALEAAQPATEPVEESQGVIDKLIHGKKKAK